MRVGDDLVRWPEFKFWLKHVTNYYRALHHLDEIADWSVEQQGLPLEEFFLQSAAEQAITAGPSRQKPSGVVSSSLRAIWLR